MSVLNRKLFSPVRMHAGGTPPHAPVGHKHSFDAERSDEQVFSDQMGTISSDISNIKNEINRQQTEEATHTKALEDAELTRSSVYITNIVKCRPPNNRKPSAAESEACMPWLNEQVNLLKPKIIILAGSTAVQSFLGINEPISKIRGQWIEKDNIKYMPIFHPSYLLRNPSKNKGKPKWLTWQDLKKVKKELNSI